MTNDHMNQKEKKHFAASENGQKVQQSKNQENYIFSL